MTDTKYVLETQDETKIGSTLRDFLVYTSGKYTAPTKEEIDANINVARKHAVALWERGFGVLCPHLNTANMEEDCNVDYNAYIHADKIMVRRSDIVYMLPNWKDSKGAGIEKDEAIKHRISVVHGMGELDILIKNMERQARFFKGTV